MTDGRRYSTGSTRAALRQRSNVIAPRFPYGRPKVRAWSRSKRHHHGHDRDAGVPQAERSHSSYDVAGRSRVALLQCRQGRRYVRPAAAACSHHLQILTATDVILVRNVRSRGADQSSCLPGTYWDPAACCTGTLVDSSCACTDCLGMGRGPCKPPNPRGTSRQSNLIRPCRGLLSCVTQTAPPTRSATLERPRALVCVSCHCPRMHPFVEA